MKKTACGKKRRCTDKKATWCVGHVAKFVDFERGDDTCIHVGRKGNCTNDDAWPENQKEEDQ